MLLVKLSIAAGWGGVDLRRILVGSDERKPKPFGLNENSHGNFDAHLSQK